MYKKSLIVILCIMLCFCVVNCYAGGSTHHNDTITTTNNYYDTSTDYYYDYDYNYDYDCSNREYDITNNYTGTYYHTNDNRIINNIDNTYNIDNSGIENNQLIQQHTDINTEANTLLTTQLADVKYGGVAIVPPEVNPNVIYHTITTLYFNPSEIVAKLGPGEFSSFNIYVTSDRPIKLYLSANRPNIKILDPVITIDKWDGVAQAGVIVSLEKGTYWTDGLITFRSELGVDLGQIRVVFENKKAIDHVSRVTMDDTFTTLGHGVRQNRGTWGWSGFVGVRVNRETNDKKVYGTLTYDW